MDTMKSRGQDRVMHYQLGNIFNLCPQAASSHQLIVKSSLINFNLDVEMMIQVAINCCFHFTEF